MVLHFDTAKNTRNMEKHGVDFATLVDFEWQQGITKQDKRYDYGELRFITYAPLKGRLHCLVWTVRGGEMRPISLRKANARERKRYEEETRPG